MNFVPLFVIGFMSTICFISAASNDSPPNVVFVLCDDLGYGDLACFGSPDIHTPHLDAFADSGLKLESFYVNSPVCSPTRAAKLTGRFPSTLGMHYVISGDRKFNDSYHSVGWLDENIPTLYDAFKEAGYIIGHYGKWHLGSSNDGQYGKNAPEPSEYGAMHYGCEQANGPSYAIGNEIKDDTNKSDLVFKRGIEFINEHCDSPFFLSLWTQDPHSVVAPLDSQIEEYSHLFPEGVGNKWPGSRAIYNACITNIDRQFKVFMEELERLGLRENTIVIFTSDNGPATMYAKAVSHAGTGSAGPFRGVKGTLYEGGIRVPFIISWPRKIPEGTTDTSSVVAIADMPLTLTKMAGISPDILTQQDGENRSEVLLGTPSNRSKPLYFDFRGPRNARSSGRSPHMALRDGDWKLLTNLAGDRIELYNLSEDQTESTNVVSHYPEIAKKMTDALRKWGHALPRNEGLKKATGNDTWAMPSGY